MFVGYSPGHDWDCYEMWDPKTKHVHQSCDVIWLRRMMYSKEDGAQVPALEPVVVIPSEDGSIKFILDEDEMENVNARAAAIVENMTLPPVNVVPVPRPAGRDVTAGLGVVTRYGHTIRRLFRMDSRTVEQGRLTQAEVTFYSEMQELGKLVLFVLHELYLADP